VAGGTGGRWRWRFQLFQFQEPRASEVAARWRWRWRWSQPSALSPQPCHRPPRGRQKKIDGPPRTFAKSQTHPPTIRLFFLDFFLKSRFWAFLGEGSSKTRSKKYRKNKSDPSPFLASDPPTHHGGHRFFFNWRPLACHCHCHCRTANCQLPTTPTGLQRLQTPAQASQAGGCQGQGQGPRAKAKGKGPAPKKSVTVYGDPRGGRVGQSTKKKKGWGQICFFSIYFYRVFELSSPRNARKRNKKNREKISFGFLFDFFCKNFSTRFFLQFCF
jgi:hypothetical protein